MKAFATIGLGSLGSISFQHSIHALPSDRPHGVPPDCWIRLDEKLGLVIDSPQDGGHIAGRFMVRRQDGVWQRLSLREPDRISGNPGSPQAPGG